MGWFESKAEKDAWRTASLHYISGRLSFPFYVPTVPSDEQLNFVRKQLAEARDWVRTIADPRMRLECERWCDHSQYCISECETEKRTGRFQKSMDAIGDEWKRSDALANEILSGIRHNN